MCVGVAREKIGISYIDQGSHHDTSTQEFNNNCHFLSVYVLMFWCNALFLPPLLRSVLQSKSSAAHFYSPTPLIFVFL